MQNHKFIFIGGLHRSGTSILFKCLRDHPAISGFANTGVYEDEGQHLQSVYPPAIFYGGPGRFGFRSEAHLTEDSSLVSEENREKLFSEWAKYWDTDKPFLLEKSPPTLIMARFLQAMFHDVYFIITLRHPVAVSFATRKIMEGRSTIHSLIGHWLTSHEIFNRDKGNIKNLFVMQYENFVKRPQEHLKKIYSFLGLENNLTELKVHSSINQKYFDAWNQLDKNIFSKAYIKFLKLKFENQVNQFGYSLHDLGKIGSGL